MFGILKSNAIKEHYIKIHKLMIETKILKGLEMLINVFGEDQIST